jgi:dienelactone hydrolase
MKWVSTPGLNARSLAGGKGFAAESATQTRRPIVCFMRSASWTVACVSLVFATAGAGASAREVGAGATTVRLVVTPSSALVDQPVDVRVTGLHPKQKIVLVTSTRDRLGVAWRSQVRAVADRSGVVDTRSSMKLFWSMLPVAKRSTPTAFALSRGPAAILIRALIDGKPVAGGTLSRRGEASGLTSTDTTVAKEGFVGTYYALPGATPQPAVLQLGGSLGGHSELPAALLASHGYPSLSLAYFKEPGLPPTLRNIPFEYFEKALRWLGSQPGVDPNHVVLLGVSRGAEAALLLGATYPDLVHGVVACTTDSQVLGGFPGGGTAWTLGGNPIPLGPIPVERIVGPVLVTGGGKDEVVDSAQGVRDIVSRARSHGIRDVTGEIYPNAGHGIGCLIPNVPITGQIQIGPSTYGETGGTPAANEQAAAASWPLVLRLLGA